MLVFLLPQVIPKFPVPACVSDAMKVVGSADEDESQIPGTGRWAEMTKWKKRQECIITPAHATAAAPSLRRRTGPKRGYLRLLVLKTNFVSQRQECGKGSRRGLRLMAAVNCLCVVHQPLH